MRKIIYVPHRIKARHRKVWTILATLLIVALALCAFTSCKAWRTLSTTATYTQLTDSTKVTTTINTKMVEEYQGVKKR